MIIRPGLGVMWAAIVALLAGCASVDDGGLPQGGDLGEGKQEFETVSQGGVYRFQYVTEGSDGYRTVLWRQGESLSDDRKDEKLVAGVVRSVFHERFCKEMKLPVSYAGGSPAPLGTAGKWHASLRCASPPPVAAKPKPEKAPAKKEAKEPAAASVSQKKTAPVARPASDGPMVCTKTATGFDCKPKS